MLRFHEAQRLKLIPLAAVALAAGYFFVLRPLKERGQQLDQPLAESWQQLAAVLDPPATSNSVDFQAITQRLQAARRSQKALAAIARTAAARVALDEAMEARIRAPFQLVDYQDERQKVIDELSQLSQQHQVRLEPEVFRGFPDYVADLEQPSLLWAELAFIKHLLATVIQCRVEVVHRIRVPQGRANPAAADPSPGPREVPLLVELTGSTNSVAACLRSLPLRAAEIQAAGLPDAYPDKPALLIDRLILRRQSPNKPDEVHLQLTASGFVFPE